MVAATLVLVFFNISDNSHAFAQTSELDSLFEQLQSENPDNLELTVEKIWREWRKSGSDSVDFLLDRGMESMDRGQYNEAIDHLTAAIDHAPDFAEAWNMRATAFFYMGEYGLSVADIEQTLILNPRHFGAMSGLAMILERSEQPDRALEVYKKVIELHPGSEQALEAVERLSSDLQGTPL